MQAIFVIATLLGIVSASGNTAFGDPIMSSTCLGKFNGVFHSFIFYVKNETSKDYYCIRTAWLMTYPSRIRTELKQHGMVVLNSNPVDKCGWITLAHIEKNAVSTGDIFKKGNTIDELTDIASNILFDLYPSLEISLLVCIPILAAMLWFAHCLWNADRVRRPYNWNNDRDWTTPSSFNHVNGARV